LAAGAVLSGPASAADWLPVTDAERNLNAPKVEKDAPAEVLLWRVHVERNEAWLFSSTVYQHYIRIKLFNHFGCQSQGSVRLPASAEGTVSGRTIKLDGRVLPLAKSAISIRDAVVYRGLKSRVVTFALPGLEPGDIIEYKWTENAYDFEPTLWSDFGWSYAPCVRLQLSRDIPVEQVTYFIRGLSTIGPSPVTLNAVPFQTELPSLKKGKGGFYTVSMEDVPAAADEPMMPPEAQAKPWLLLHYIFYEKTPEQYWKGIGKDTFGLGKRVLKPDADIRRAAAEAVGGATDPQDQLARIALYCRAKIKSLAAGDVTEQQRRKARQSWFPGDVLKRGLGTDSEVNVLFAALAAAARFDARLAMVADRGDIPFRPALVDADLLPRAATAVKLGGVWSFWNAADRELPPDTLPWQAEGVLALIGDPDTPLFVPTPFSGPEKSVTSRTASFELKEDGTLQGTVRLTYSGHDAAQRRKEWKTESAAKREESVREAVRKQYDAAQLSEVRVENADGAERPLECSYLVTIPGYAQKTGKRMFLQMDYFDRGQPARFAANSRRYPVFFDYAWTEEDQVIVKVPPGYSLESPEAPGPVDLGEIGSYEVTVMAGAGKLVQQRKLVFAHGGRLVFPVAAYPQLKQAFDAIHEGDQHALALRQTD
jgi:hypothetical protein